MQFRKLEKFNLAYLYVLHVLSKHFARKQNCLKMSKHRNKSNKIKYKAKNEKKKEKKRDITTENERKSSKKVKRKKNEKKKTKTN